MSLAALADRARRYVARMPVSVAGQGGHAAAFEVACVLLKGFGLPMDVAAGIMAVWNAGCMPPWSPRELEHKLRQATGAARDWGYLLKDEGGRMKDEGERNKRVAEALGAAVSPEGPRRIGYDEAALGKLAQAVPDRVDMVWLANRSQVDPALVDSDGFLSMMYRRGERVVVLPRDQHTGAVWPVEPLPEIGTEGMKFMIQPVHGDAVLVPRLGKKSRRAEECVTAWRYLLLESDEAPVGLWLRALAGMRLPVAAVYSSGGRSVHVLVKVDAATKSEWDVRVRPLKRWMEGVGADPGAMSAVRLSRLPGQWRAERSKWQRLLYVNAFPLVEPLVAAAVRRDVARDWVAAARAAWMEQDEEGMRAALRALRYYSAARPELSGAADDLEAGMTQMGVQTL